MGAGSTDFGGDALLLQLLARDGFTVEAAAGPTPRPSNDPAPAGPAQRRFWIQEQIAATPGVDNLGCLLRFGAPLDRPALARALSALAARHEALRSRFEERAGEILEIVEAPSAVVLERLEGAGLAEAALRSFVERPYRLEQAPLWRVAVFDGPEAGDALLLGCHHAILDWTGVRRLVEELTRLYEAERSGAAADLPPPPLQQADVAHWLRREDRRERLEAARLYWRDRLAGLGPGLELAAATPQTASGDSRCGAVPLALDEALSDGVRRFAAEHRSTVFMVLLAAYASVLGRFALAEEVVVGTAVDNRDGPETEAVVGCLTDMVALRCDLSGEPSFGALVQRLHTAGARDFEHQALGFAELVTLLAPERRSGATPLFQAIFNLLPATPDRPDLPSLSPIQPGLARADLALEIHDQGPRFAGRLEYREGLLAPAVAEALAEALACLLRHGLEAPERLAAQLPLAEPRAAAALHARLNPPLPAAPERSLGDLFVARAERQPEAVALWEGTRSVSFGELLERSTALAERLVEAGLEPGRPVALCLERSAELAVALLAAVRAGGAALPLDPAYPAERLAAILQDSGAPWLIAPARPAWLPEDAACRLLVPDARAATGAPLPRVEPDRPAYLVYTSGSTGRPKGVVGLHRGAVNRLAWMERAFPFVPGERCCQKTSTAFVDFVAEFFGPLLAGVPSAIADAATARDPRALTDLIRERRVTRIVLVPSLLRTWLDTLPDVADRLASLRLAVCSGEILPPELARRFKAALPGCRLLNLYGSSEVSADAAWHEVEGKESGRVPLGRPIPGNSIALLDASGQPLPIGAPGEIVVGGLGVAGGYLGDPGASAGRFEADPAGGLRFRTGDLGFWDAEGRLAYLGRRDRQVKIQGVRVEPGEIETALNAHPRVHESCVLAQGDGRSARLVAYVAAAPGTRAQDLREHLSGRLPRALVPETVQLLDRLPLNASGKVDVAALPAPEPEAGAGGERAPLRALDPLEALVAEAWSVALGRPVASAEQDFFALGGSSLQAILATARLGEALGRPLPVAMLFETPRLSELARRLAADEAEDEPLPTPEPGAGAAPATFNQAWLWEEYRREPARIAYNLSVAYRLEGPLDADALGAALDDLVTRHEALRTRLVPAEEGLEQRVEAPPGEALQRHDLTGAADPEVALDDLVEEIGRRPFALDRDPPFRAALARLEEQRHCLVLVLHHAAGDGWSGQILVRELAALYRARQQGAAPPAAPALQGGDIGRWQQGLRPLLARRLESYRQALAGAETPRPAGLTRGAAAGGPAGLEPVPLDSALLERFLRPARAGVPGVPATPFLRLLAAWAALLARFGDCERPLLATPLAGRGVAGLPSVVGFLANAVLLAPDLRESPSFDRIVEAARDALLAALRHQDVPLAWIQASGAGWPLEETGDALRAMLVLEDARDWNLDLPGVTARLVCPPQSPEARVDLALLVTETDAGPLVRLEYAERRVPKALAARLAQGLAALIAAATEAPSTPLDRLPLLSGERDGAEVFLAPAAGPVPMAERLDVLLSRQAAARPDALAACDGTPEGKADLTYAGLERRVDALAGRLRALGVAPGDRVALVAAASPRQLAGLFAIWRAGATAVPLDPAHPQARIAALLEESAAAAALVDAPLDQPCPQLRLDATATSGPAVPAPPGAPAAVVYTSGTTGRPKGVLLAQDALCRLGAALAERYGLGAGDRVLQVVSPAFDVALSDVAMTVSAGATLVLPPREAVMAGRSLATILETAGVTHLQAPAAVLAATEPPALPALRAVAVGGEACPPATARAWAAGRRLFIAYGPSEATVTAALADYDGSAHPATLGRAFAGARLEVLDAGGAALPVGVSGELVIAGPNVGLGYLGQPDLTAARFEPDPDPAAGVGARRYRTGDRARREADGSLTFLGRLDRQVKLRGVRVEPGETEAALMALPGVARALAAVRADSLGERRLVAWLVATPGVRPDPLRLRQELRRRLPEQLVPSLLAEIAEVPLTANGKVDWAALPTPAAASPAARAPAAHPEPAMLSEAALRRQLAGLWAALLDRPEVGPDDNFFDIGGHSLLVVRLQQRLDEQFGVELPVGELFAHPTPRGLAGRLRQALQPAPPRTAPAAQFEDFTL